MAVTPPETTNRLKVHYAGPFGAHTMLFHGVTGVDQATLIAAVRAIVTLMAAIAWNGTSFGSAEYAAAGSELFFPVSWTPIVSSSGSNPTGVNNAAVSLNYVGRGTDGVRVKLYQYEAITGIDRNMRVSFAEGPGVEAIVEALTTNDGVIGTVSGSVPTWKPYANIVVNDKKTRQIRA